MSLLPILLFLMMLRPRPGNFLLTKSIILLAVLLSNRPTGVETMTSHSGTSSSILFFRFRIVFNTLSAEDVPWLASLVEMCTITSVGHLRSSGTM